MTKNDLISPQLVIRLTLEEHKTLKVAYMLKKTLLKS